MTAACLGLGMQKFSDPCRQQAVTAEDPVLQGLREVWGLGIWGCKLFWSEFRALALWDVDVARQGPNCDIKELFCQGGAKSLRATSSGKLQYSTLNPRLQSQNPELHAPQPERPRFGRILFFDKEP